MWECFLIEVIGFMIETWKIKNQKPLNGEPYLTARIVGSKLSTFWYAREIGETYYIHATRRQHKSKPDGTTPGDWYYQVVDPSGSGKVLSECDIMILDDYKIPEELFEI
jgi:hypothetical protein